MAAIDPQLSIRAVRLAVADLSRSADFYERVLGLPLIARDDRRAELGGDPERPALMLEHIPAATPLPPSASGLFHVAWLHPSRAALADTVRRVAAAGWPLEGASDHGVSEAVYLGDPDGLGIEIYADRRRELWERPAGGRGVQMVTLPLDVRDLLAQASAEPQERVAPGTGIGHVHLKVADVPRTASFYTGALGFEEQATIPSAAFVSAGGYHHHVGLNSWQSAGAPPAPDTAPGLRAVEFQLSRAPALDELERGLQAAGAQPERRNGQLAVRDPDGELLEFSAQQ
jgi:catechol 2,3-dioxygenase